MQKKLIFLCTLFAILNAEQKITMDQGKLWIQSDNCEKIGQVCQDGNRPGTCISRDDQYYDSSKNTMEPMSYLYCEHNNDPALVAQLLEAANKGRWCPFVESSPTDREVAEIYLAKELTLFGQAFLASFYPNVRNAYVYEAHQSGTLKDYFLPVIQIPTSVVFEALLMPLAQQTPHSTNASQVIYTLKAESIALLHEMGIYENILAKLESPLLSDEQRGQLISMQNFLASYGINERTPLQKGKNFVKHIKTKCSLIVEYLARYIDHLI